MNALTMMHAAYEEDTAPSALIEALLTLHELGPSDPHPLDSHTCGGLRIDRADLAPLYSALQDMVIDAHQEPTIAASVANHLASVCAWFDRTYPAIHLKHWVGEGLAQHQTKPKRFWLNYKYPATQYPAFRYKLRTLCAEALSLAAEHNLA